MIYHTKLSQILMLAVLSPINTCLLAGEVGASTTKPKILKELDAHLFGEASSQKILVMEAEPGVMTKKLLITTEAVTDRPSILVAPLALPLISNSYSPASYDGFEVGVLSGGAGITNIIDTQGERTTLRYAPARAGDFIYLKTTEEDNSEYSFNLQFKYNNNTKKITMANLFLTTNNKSCDRSLTSVYAIASSRLALIPLETFNGLDAFNYLKQLHVDSQSRTGERRKLMPTDVENNFIQALAAHKKGDIEKLKEIMDYFIVSGGEDASCAPESYIVEKYYYPEALGWSNDLGFLFERSGHYEEAIALLSHIVSENPTRVVAYLNLADSYWALNKKDMAATNYKIYKSLMIKKGSSSKIPKRVTERG